MPVIVYLDEQYHDLETRGFVICALIQSMTEINTGSHRRRKSSGRHVCDLRLGPSESDDVAGLCDYVRGGYAKQVKIPTTVSFKPLSAAAKSPEFVFTDFDKMGRMRTTQACFAMLDDCPGGALPKLGSADDAGVFAKHAASLMVPEFVFKSGVKIAATDTEAREKL